MKKYFFITLLILVCKLSVATHLTSADIRLEKRLDISSKTYDIILTVYYLKSSVDVIPELDVNTQDVDVSDASRDLISSASLFRDFSQDEVLSNTFSEPLLKRVFKGTYTFAISNVSRIISYTGDQRRSGIENVTDRPGLGDWEIYVETMFFVNPGSLSNSTPVLNSESFALAVKDRPFYYDINASDIESDSLSYELTELKYINGSIISEQWFPDDPKFGASSFRIHPNSGVITWDSPETIGLFNIAVQVNEWRDGIRVSYIVRDFSIEVFESLPFHDLGVELINLNQEESNLYDYELRLRNGGDFVDEAQVKLILNPGISLEEVDFPFDSRDGDTLFWDYVALQSLSDTTISLTLSILDESLILNTDYVLKAIITPLGEDLYSANNEVKAYSLTTVGINVSPIASVVDVYPNPSSKLIYFLEPVEQVQIISTQGEILNQYIKVNKINVEFLNSGNYILLFKKNQKWFSQKFVKN